MIRIKARVSDWLMWYLLFPRKAGTQQEYWLFFFFFSGIPENILGVYYGHAYFQFLSHPVCMNEWMDGLVCVFLEVCWINKGYSTVRKAGDSTGTCSNTRQWVTSLSAGICSSNDMMVDFVSLFELQKSCCPLDICCHPFCLAIYSMYNFNANRKWHGEMDGTISELNRAGHVDLLWRGGSL